MAVSSDARAVLAYCATHLHSTAVREIGGKRCPTVWLNWNGLARVLGYAQDCSESTRRALAALDELRGAGLLASYDEGPNCFGHSTLCFVPQD